EELHSHITGIAREAIAEYSIEDSIVGVEVHGSELYPDRSPPASAALPDLQFSPPRGANGARVRVMDDRHPVDSTVQVAGGGDSEHLEVALTAGGRSAGRSASAGRGC